MRVKVLFAKKDNALIQMAESGQATLALAHLDKLRLLGRTMHVTLSRHSSVQLPREGQPDSGLTRDFSSCSQLHRFKKPGSKNYCNIFPPSTTLHLSNIPSSVSEQEIRDLFSRSGLPSGAAAVTNFKFFPRGLCCPDLSVDLLTPLSPPTHTDRKMALVSLATLDDAILALVVSLTFFLPVLVTGLTH